MTDKSSRNALLVYPKFPPSFWGFKYAIEFVGKKSSMPPLGLLTVAAMFPPHYHLKVVDMNIEELTDAHLEWADLVFTSTMIVQQKSLREVIARCNKAKVPVIAGGPHPTSFYDEISGVDHFILDEVENIFPTFLEDLENGQAKPLYRSPTKPDVTKTPLPRYDLIDIQAYGSMALQFSRGCPFDCEFCDITKLFGRVPRTKTNEQMLAEFDLLYDLGWRGPVFLVDDNFIGNKRDAMRLLPEIINWQQKHGYPFSLYTEASVNLVELEPMMDAMVEAGFGMAFLGIESPNPEALKKTKKGQNTKQGQENYLLHAVRTLQHKGIEVMGGFILGLDGDGPEVFDAQVNFIQEAGIPMAMVGLLTALRGTNLYKRLEQEGRLIKESNGNNVDIALNFEPELDKQTLVEGYKRVLSTLYDPTLSNYFERCWILLKHIKPSEHLVRKTGKTELLAFARSLRRQLLSKQGPAYAKFLMRVLLSNPKLLPEAVRLAVMGYHFEKLTAETIAVADFNQSVNTMYEEFEKTLAQAYQAIGDRAIDVRDYAQQALTRIRTQYEKIHMDFRDSVNGTFLWFQENIKQYLEHLDEIREFYANVSIFQHLFKDEIWETYVRNRGYRLAEQLLSVKKKVQEVGEVLQASPRAVAIAPTTASLGFVKSLEIFFHELGIQVVNYKEQLASLHQQGHQWLVKETPEAIRLLDHYLSTLSNKADYVLVPLAGEIGNVVEKVQNFFNEGEPVKLPGVIRLPYDKSIKGLRNHLTHIGLAFTDDLRKIEQAYNKALAVMYPEFAQ